MPIPKYITRFNKHVTNRVILTFAGWFPPFAVIHHVGRRTGRAYRAPVLAFKFGTGFIVALTYGRDVDWLKNLFAKGSGELELRCHTVPVSAFRVTPYNGDAQIFPAWVRSLLSLISVKECLFMDSVAYGISARRAYPK